MMNLQSQENGINGNSVCTGLMGTEMKPTQLENHLTKIYMTSMNMRKIAIYISRQKSLQILSNTYSKCLFTVSRVYTQASN